MNPLRRSLLGSRPAAAAVVGLLVLASPLALQAEAKKRVPALDKTSVVVTDFTEKGGELPPVSPANPVYFVGINAGFRAYNGVWIANDPPPPEAAMLGIITEVLSAQGYRAADASHPPTQAIVCSWGMIGVHSSWVNGTGPAFAFLQKKGEVHGSEIPGNLSAAFLKRGQDSTLVELSRGHLYAIVLRAFDWSAAEGGKIVPLWETRIACGANGVSMKTALPRLVVSAQHSIGRETRGSVVENAARTRHAWVEYVPPEYLDFYNASDLAKARQQKAKATPKPEQK